MSFFEELLPKTAQEEMFSQVKGDLLNQLNDLVNQCGITINDISLEFKDPDFLTHFFQIFSKEEQKNYLLTAYNYDHNKQYDLNYLLVFRRAIYTKYEKNENFWSTSFNDVRFGLKREQPIGSPVRLYSSIMVTTAGKLMNHGLTDLDHGGATDGEIAIDDTKPFSDFLFIYKPSDETKELNQYISSGGMSYEDIVTYLSNTAEERNEDQGFKK